MTKVVAKVQPLTQSQKYFMTAAFILISLMFFLVVWHWHVKGLVTPESSHIQEITHQVYKNKSLTSALESPIIYQAGEYSQKTNFHYPNPLHYISILITAGLFGLINIQLIGTMLITMSIIFLAWKLSEELSLHLDTLGDESLFFIKVLVWVASLAFFSPYWTPWFSPELLYCMLVLAALYSMFRFYRLRSYPDGALAFVWLIFSMIVSAQAIQIGAVLWLVWFAQFILLSRKSKVFKRSMFILSISTIVIGSYWVYFASNFTFSVDLTQSAGVQIIADANQATMPAVMEILQEVELSKENILDSKVTYIRFPLLVMLGLGSVYIFYKRRSAGFFMTTVMLGALIFISQVREVGLGNMPFLAPYVVFLTIAVSLRVFRRVPEIHRFALSGFFLSITFLFIFPTMDTRETQSMKELDEISEMLQEVDPDRQVIFSTYAIPQVTTVYDPRFDHISKKEDQIYVWDNLYQSNYWLTPKSSTQSGLTDLQDTEYFEKVSETDNWILYQRKINYLR